MENLQVILSLLLFLGLGSAFVQYATTKRIRAKVLAQKSTSEGELEENHK